VVDPVPHDGSTETTVPMNVIVAIRCRVRLAGRLDLDSHERRLSVKGLLPHDAFLRATDASGSDTSNDSCAGRDPFSAVSAVIRELTRSVRGSCRRSLPGPPSGLVARSPTCGHVPAGQPGRRRSSRLDEPRHGQYAAAQPGRGRRTPRCTSGSEGRPSWVVDPVRAHPAPVGPAGRPTVDRAAVHLGLPVTLTSTRSTRPGMGHTGR
jgi:hypothetical protein